MTRLVPALLAAALAIAPAAARADTPISGAFELKLGSYFPNVDAEPGLTGKPYKTAFNDKHILLFELEWERQFFQRFGSLAGGISAGYGEVYGKGRFDATGATTSDNTSLKVVPIKAMLVYRFDVLERMFHVPLIPFAKGGVVCELYRISNGAGDTAESGGDKGEGAKWGYEGHLGLALELDWIEPNLAKDFDLDVGVNHTFVFAEYQYTSPTRPSLFKAPSGLNLSDKFWMFGLGFEY